VTRQPRSRFDHLGAQLGARVRQSRRIVEAGGTSALGRRWLASLARRLPVEDVPMVNPSRVIATDLAHPFEPEPLVLEPGSPMTVNWITSPPAWGSGGHTTSFRMIRYLEQQGHTCRIYLHDVYGGDARRYEPLIRQLFPDVVGSVHDLDSDLADAHATFATSWPTAYVLFNSRHRGARCYLVQDFEPWFYPRGTDHVLSENTYRMGFHAVTAGRWLAQVLRDDYGMTADHFDFGCDTERYRILDGADIDERRRSVAFYSRGGTPRRAAELGFMTMQVLAELRPDVTVHIYGEDVRDPPFRAVQHGVVSPDALNDIYNRCGAGLSLSMTNVSLVPHEMLAAGCIPVVNDAAHNRVVLDNPFVRYATAHPRSLAAEVLAVLDQPDLAANAAKAAASVIHDSSWDDAGAALERSLRAHVERIQAH
jgi:glycosyltransferase involved in cell wall biosynthesis